MWTRALKKMKQREAFRRWYEKNRDSVIAKNNAWKKANPEKRSEQRKRNYERNREREIARSARRAKENPERARRYRIDYYYAHHDEELSRQKEYRAKNRTRRVKQSRDYYYANLDERRRINRRGYHESTGASGLVLDVFEELYELKTITRRTRREQVTSVSYCDVDRNGSRGPRTNQRG